MTGRKPFGELTADISDERRAEIDAKKERLIAESVTLLNKIRAKHARKLPRRSSVARIVYVKT